MDKKKKYSAQKKIEILRENLENQVPISQLCERYQINPSQIYAWKKKLFEGALQIFSSNKQNDSTKKIKTLSQKLQDRESLISSIVSENFQLKKNLNGEI